MGERHCNQDKEVPLVNSTGENVTAFAQSALDFQERQTIALEKIADLLEKFYFRTEKSKIPVSYK